MEVKVLVQEVTGHDPTTVRHGCSQDVPGAKVCTQKIQQADIDEGGKDPDQEEPDHLLVPNPVPDLVPGRCAAIPLQGSAPVPGSRLFHGP